MKYCLNEAIRSAWDGSEVPPEQGLIDWARQFVRPGSTFVDAGAHVGSWALSLAENCREVHAFEAQRETFYRLCAGILENGLANTVSAHHCALGDGAGHATLRVISRDGGGSSTVSLPTHQTPLAIERVERRTLDSFGIRNVSLLKVDVEGAEIEVLRGAMELINRDQPAILFECWDENRMAGAVGKKLDIWDFVTRVLRYRIYAINHYGEMFLAEPHD